MTDSARKSQRSVCPKIDLLEAKFAEEADHLQEQVDRLMKLTCENERNEVREQIYMLRVARTAMWEALNAALSALKSAGRTHDSDMMAKVGKDHERAYEIAKTYVCEWFNAPDSVTGWSMSTSKRSDIGSAHRHDSASASTTESPMSKASQKSAHSHAHKRCDESELLSAGAGPTINKYDTHGDRRDVKVLSSVCEKNGTCPDNDLLGGLSQMNLQSIQCAAVGASDESNTDIATQSACRTASRREGQNTSLSVANSYAAVTPRNMKQPTPGGPCPDSTPACSGGKASSSASGKDNARLDTLRGLNMHPRSTQHTTAGALPEVHTKVGRSSSHREGAIIYAGTQCSESSRFGGGVLRSSHVRSPSISRSLAEPSIEPRLSRRSVSYNNVLLDGAQITFSGLQAGDETRKGSTPGLGKCTDQLHASVPAIMVEDEHEQTIDHRSHQRQTEPTYMTSNPFARSGVPAASVGPANQAAYDSHQPFTATYIKTQQVEHTNSRSYEPASTTPRLALPRGSQNEHIASDIAYALRQKATIAFPPGQPRRQQVYEHHSTSPEVQTHLDTNSPPKRARSAPHAGNVTSHAPRAARQVRQNHDSILRRDSRQCACDHASTDGSEYDNEIPTEEANCRTNRNLVNPTLEANLDARNSPRARSAPHCRNNGVDPKTHMRYDDMYNSNSAQSRNFAFAPNYYQPSCDRRGDMHGMDHFPNDHLRNQHGPEWELNRKSRQHGHYSEHRERSNCDRAPAHAIGLDRWNRSDVNQSQNYSAYPSTERHRDSPEYRSISHQLPIATDEVAASSSNRAAKKELLDSAGRNPFDGAAYKFATWKRLLLHKTRGVDLSADDWLMVLESNTSGAPRQLVREFSTCSSQADLAVRSIWKRLEARFGDSSLVATSIRSRLESFEPIRSNQPSKLREFSDLLHVALANIQANPDLFSLNTSTGLEPIRTKLPESLRDRWRIHGTTIVKQTGQFPSFSQFVNFVEDVADELNSPLFNTQSKHDNPHPKHDSNRWPQGNRNQPTASHRVYSTTTDEPPATGDEPHCVSHPNARHNTADCNEFRALTATERHRLVLEQSRCFMCFGKHRRSECNRAQGLKCETCGSAGHNTLVHHQTEVNQRHRRGQRHQHTSKRSTAKTVRATVMEAMDATEATEATPRSSTVTDNAIKEPAQAIARSTDVIVLKTASQGLRNPRSRNCGKCVLVDVHDANTGKTTRTYAVIDDCSTASFIDVSLISELNSPTVPTKYIITTLDRVRAVKWGSICSGLSVRGANQAVSFPLPRLLSCENMPDTTDEVARPVDVKQVPHLSHLAGKFCEFDHSARVGLLIGRDACTLMKWTYHGKEPPFAVQSELGWALVGPVEPVSDSADSVESHQTVRFCATTPGAYSADVFQRRWDDDELGRSVEDDRFLELLTQNVCVNIEGHLQLPLPFREAFPKFPPNRRAILRRQTATLNQLKRHAGRLADARDSMEKSLKSGQIEKATPPSDDEPYNYISVFQVHNKRKQKYRLVYDSSATCDGVSLNSRLIQGPDHNNRITSVLLRFREHAFAIVADVENMYNNFYVPPSQRTYQRLFWWTDNQPDKPIAEFRAATHVFGHKSSPAVAIFALRHAAAYGSDHDPLVMSFVNRSFYVDDALHSADSVAEAISTMAKTRSALEKYKIRLHKLVANSTEILDAFPEADCAATTVDLDMTDECREQRTLGVSWNIASDSFTVAAGETERPFTKRGVLSVINSIYDPFNFTSPVVLKGRLFLREMLSSCSSLGWDERLPSQYADSWNDWLRLLPLLSEVKVPRPLKRSGFSATHRLLIGFGDASAVAIGFVIYLRSSNEHGDVDIGFVCAASKVAPRAATTIPRLELCSSLELARTTARVRHEMSLPIDGILLFTDSTSVLGFLSNYQRRYTVYVSNRVSAIRNVIDPGVWRFVRSEDNPADLASRPSVPTALNSFWFEGPNFIREREIPTFAFSAKTPDELPELVQADALTIVRNTNIVRCVDESASPLSTLFRRSNDWTTIVGTAQTVLHAASKWLYKARCRLMRPSTWTWYAYETTVSVLVRSAQVDANLNENSVALAALAPFVDHSGALRIGGRLQRSSLPYDTRHPLLLPDINDHPIAASVVTHYHEKSAHQGRIISAGAVRNAGFFILHSAKAVRRIISNCIICRELRATPMQQRMADLPEDRLERTAPFLTSAMDVFGPYHVKTGLKTRRSPGSNKAWVAIFTCLYSRAVHCEVLLGMDTSTFLLAFRRFVATRGECKRLRCDNGTNFRGADSDLLALDEAAMKTEGATRDVEFIFSPPKASHVNGVVERKVGSVRAVLDSTLSLMGHHILTFDEFSTFVSEASSIVNHTPMEAESSDGEAAICPANLLTLKDTPTPPPSGTFDESSLSSYGRKRWERVQYLADNFWQRWKTGYLLAQQQHRKKWATTNRSLAQGDVVLMVEKNTKRNSWCKAKVVETIPSSDGLVRKVIVRTFISGKAKDFQRSVHDLVLLVAVQ